MNIVLNILYFEGADIVVNRREFITVYAGAFQLISIIRSQFENDIIAFFQDDMTKIIVDVYNILIGIIGIMDDVSVSCDRYDIRLTMIKIHILIKVSAGFLVEPFICSVIIGGPDDGKYIALTLYNSYVIGFGRSELIIIPAVFIVGKI